MEPQAPTPKSSSKQDQRELVPNESRRKVINKLAAAIIMVPVVTLIADATSNVAAAS
jgi:hypothetical protein